LPSATRPVPHSETVPVPTYLVDFTEEDDMETEGATTVLSRSDEEFLPSQEGKPHLVNQLELNNLVRDLNLTKTQAEILGSRLQGWKLLEPDTRISVYRNRQKEFARGTRFNLKYVKPISDIIGKFETFRVEKVCSKNLTLNGGETQVVKSRPTETEDPERWNERNVHTISAATSSTATMGAAYCFASIVAIERLYKKNVLLPHTNMQLVE
jgi:hypothetical protein